MIKRAIPLLLATFISNVGWASFHLMKVVEVFPGTAGSPSAQYVTLQMYASGQNFVGGHSIIVYNAAGTSIGTFTFPGSMANGANQRHILIGTTQSAALTGVSNNLTMTPILPLAGGKVCFDSIDCVAWGNYSGSSLGVGTPVVPGGLVQGMSIRRYLGPLGALDPSADTDDSATDFHLAISAPTNNAGQGCGDGILQALEGCDDHNTSNQDACPNSCHTAFCGDSFPRAGVEDCDDGNPSDNDDCPTTCMVAICGDGFVHTGTEECDDGNPSDNDDCPTTCMFAICGDGFVHTGAEECDDANASDDDACIGGCLNATCGDNFVWTLHEDCDDGNTTGGDACPGSCLLASTPQEASAGATMRASRGVGSQIDIIYTPACGALDHAVYVGTSPIVGSLFLSGSGCGLGVSGTTAFSPGTPAPGQFYYFVLVGYTGTKEGSYGLNSAGIERPESTAGLCDRPLALGGSCP